MTSAKPLTRPSTLIELISSRLPSSSPLPQPFPPRGYKTPLRPFSPNHGELRDIFHRILTQPNEISSILAQSHRILDSQQDVHFSSPTRIHARSRLYDRLIYAFSRAPLSPALPSINDLLNRQLKEGVPVLPRSLTTLFYLAGQAGEPILPLVQKTLHLLPPGLDVQLLVMICRTIVREARGTPEDIEKIIAACYSAENKTEGEWDWSMWDILVSAHTISGDLRGALGVLKRYRKVL
ncbi:hypothetical protein TREMEDRAFT_57491, partial [Tremella mesenterica DSM 1558]|uniref:uncharacterized protein n=1 Tax=Tremella mesenterica (strain ATCC 24925 / CBS 8224 / DSM 1558 / NBRC 9311 / NRRL Y-6157 / RJB 2259-6 / UBC 559-6) TaxID=578456 RepID=UPI0003F48BE7